MNIAGFDFDSKSITWVCLRDGMWNQYRVEVKGQGFEGRFKKLVECFLLEHRDWESIDFAYIEVSGSYQNAKTTRMMMQVLGAIRGIFFLNKVDHQLIADSTWKLQSVGKGDVSKEQIQTWAVRALNMPDNLAQDFYDAACIAMAGANLMGKKQ